MNQKNLELKTYQRRHIVFLMLLLLSGSLHFVNAQAYIDEDVYCDTCAYELSFDFKSSNFIKNNEYSNAFTKGFTGIGYFLKPSFHYYSGRDIKIELGAFLEQYSGRDKYNTVTPVFSVEYKASEKLSLRLGNIKGNLNHGLEEALYRFDNYYQNNLESGLQLNWNSERFKADIWLDWKEFIFEGDDFQEKFQIGFTSMFKLFKQNGFTLSIPVQLLITHKGGEIDVSEDRASSILNGVVGISFKNNFNSDHEFEIEPLLIFYDAISIPDHGINSQIYSGGKAVYLKLSYKYKMINAMMAYWSADSFIAPGGESLFHSVSDYNPLFFEKERDLLNFKLAWTGKLSDFAEISLRIDQYYDLNNKDLAHSAGLYLSLNENFFLYKRKK